MVGSFYENIAYRREIKKVGVYRVTKHTGMIKDDRTPCGYKFFHWDCQKMTTCKELGQYDKCKSMEEKANV